MIDAFARNAGDRVKATWAYSSIFVDLIYNMTVVVPQHEYCFSTSADTQDSIYLICDSCFDGSCIQVSSILATINFLIIIMFSHVVLLDIFTHKMTLGKLLDAVRTVLQQM